MSQVIDAVFENGMFRLLSASEVQLSEGQQVRLVVETLTEAPDDLLESAAQVYQGLSGEQISEIERIALERHDLFGNRSSL